MQLSASMLSANFHNYSSIFAAREKGGCPISCKSPAIIKIHIMYFSSVNLAILLYRKKRLYMHYLSINRISSIKRASTILYFCTMVDSSAKYLLQRIKRNLLPYLIPCMSYILYPKIIYPNFALKS